MWIVFARDSKVSLPWFTGVVADAIKQSRFTAIVAQARRGQCPGIKITEVRLKRRKDNCGQHPGPCLVNKRHRKARTLEGLDWVGFNAMLNNLCDDNMLVCDIFSFNTECDGGGKYHIRKGRRRRVAYPFEFRNFGNAHWVVGDLDLVLADYLGKPSPPILSPDLEDSGTPGYPCYTLEDEDEFRRLEEPEEEKPKKRRQSRARGTASPVLV